MKFLLQGRSISSKLILYFTNILQHSLKVPQRSIFNIFMFSWVNLLGKVYCSNRLSLRDKCPFPSFSGLYFPTFGLNSWSYLVVILHKREMSSISVRWVFVMFNDRKKTGKDETFAAPYSVCVEYYLNCSLIILKSISVEAKYCNSWERYGLWFRVNGRWLYCKFRKFKAL